MRCRAVLIRLGTAPLALAGGSIWMERGCQQSDITPGRADQARREFRHSAAPTIALKWVFQDGWRGDVSRVTSHKTCHRCAFSRCCPCLHSLLPPPSSIWSISCSSLSCPRPPSPSLPLSSISASQCLSRRGPNRPAGGRHPHRPELPAPPALPGDRGVLWAAAGDSAPLLKRPCASAFPPRNLKRGVW